MANIGRDDLTDRLTRNRLNRRTLLKSAAVAGASAAGLSAGTLNHWSPMAAQEAPALPTIPEVTVRYSSLHAIDHTHIVIPVKRDWNKDVGLTIDPAPFGTSVGADKIVSGLTSGSVDISSGASVFALAGYATNDTYISFGHGDIFQGFGFMVDPEAGYKSVDDFVNDGMDGQAAIKATAEQFKGKRLATLNEGGIRGFITIALETAGMSMDDIQVDSFDTDSKIIAEMVSGRADFAVGSAPGRVSMTLEGFVPVLTSLNISQYAEPSPDSKALRAIFHDGWATTRDYYANNHDTIFRFMSMTPEDVQVIYRELDPFIAYEDQDSWYDEAAMTTNPFHYCNVTGAHIKLWEEQGVLEPGKYTCDNVSVALELWQEFKERESNSQTLVDEATAAITDPAKQTQAKELLDKATFFRQIYDFLDAEIFAQAALDWAKYEAGM
jgi:ABC-type nitrate/sulfonate/bicarbonate transport system substrate-binding protein